MTELNFVAQVGCNIGTCDDPQSSALPNVPSMSDILQIQAHLAHLKFVLDGLLVTGPMQLQQLKLIKRHGTIGFLVSPHHLTTWPHQHDPTQEKWLIHESVEVALDVELSQTICTLPCVGNPLTRKKWKEVPVAQGTEEAACLINKNIAAWKVVAEQFNFGGAIIIRAAFLETKRNWESCGFSPKRRAKAKASSRQNQSPGRRTATISAPPPDHKSLEGVLSCASMAPMPGNDLRSGMSERSTAWSQTRVGVALLDFLIAAVSLSRMDQNQTESPSPLQRDLRVKPPRKQRGAAHATTSQLHGAETSAGQVLLPSAQQNPESPW
eukprot:CAMPEP_0115302546 /NCGR_PEP_ID=MMETSP0270-20121206/70439_1 /TAXON_ID=71861 /ORGANISM="Scrippsiella trochoidea, Strain CCMP3099" /LENGTH=323 /DNA_ID=CAMNT_0002720477 /DNA_START=16 /DNA_END=985 /DNA_ORIENTATION=-